MKRTTVELSLSMVSWAVEIVLVVPSEEESTIKVIGSVGSLVDSIVVDAVLGSVVDSIVVDAVLGSVVESCDETSCDGGGDEAFVEDFFEDFVDGLAEGLAEDGVGVGVGDGVVEVSVGGGVVGVSVGGSASLEQDSNLSIKLGKSLS